LKGTKLEKGNGYGTFRRESRTRRSVFELTEGTVINALKISIGTNGELSSRVPLRHEVIVSPKRVKSRAKRMAE